MQSEVAKVMVVGKNYILTVNPSVSSRIGVQHDCVKGELKAIYTCREYGYIIAVKLGDLLIPVENIVYAQEY